MYEIPQITWFNEGEKSNDDLDKLTLHRFNIKNFTDTKNYNLSNYYVFKVNDPDIKSTTGFYGMCIQKQFAEEIKKNLELWKNSKK